MFTWNVYTVYTDNVVTTKSHLELQFHHRPDKQCHLYLWLGQPDSFMNRQANNHSTIV